MNGATVPQLMAVFGWRNPNMAIHYIQAADRARLARDAASLLLPAQVENEKRPHIVSGEGARGNPRIKSGA
jgi:hypothetical protein